VVISPGPVRCALFPAAFVYLKARFSTRKVPYSNQTPLYEKQKALFQ
jgi:hypothetical protein